MPLIEKDQHIIGFDRPTSENSPIEGKVTLADLVNVIDKIELGDPKDIVPKEELKIPIASVTHILSNTKDGATYAPSEL